MGPTLMRSAIKIVCYSIILFCLAPKIYAEENVLEPNDKIGPFIHQMLGGNSKEHKRSPGIMQDNEKSEDSDLIKVIVVLNEDKFSELSPELISILEEKVKNLGGYIVNTAFNKAQVWIPLDKIPELAEWEKVKLIKIHFFLIK